MRNLAIGLLSFGLVCGLGGCDDDGWHYRHGWYGASTNQIVFGINQTSDKLAKREVSSVIFGARSLEQLEDNLMASDFVLPEAAVKQLDEASAFELGYPYAFLQNVQGRW